MEAVTIDTFEGEFVSLQANIKSYLYRITANEQDAEDLTHETYLRGIRSISGFSGRSSLKTWIFAIATNLARDQFRAKQRWHENIQDQCKVATKASPEKVQTMHDIVGQSDASKYEFKEHIDYCFTCISKTLVIEHQLTLILREIYGFKVSEIMEILQMTEGQVKHAIADSRHIMTDIFDRRCALVNKNGPCHECSEIAGFINPAQVAREKELEMVRIAERGSDKEHLFELRAELVRSVDPLNAPGSTLHAYLLGLMPLHVLQSEDREHPSS